jgi:serine/threonine protein kinase
MDQETIVTPSFSNHFRGPVRWYEPADSLFEGPRRGSSTWTEPVAIKVLPKHSASDPAMKQRFEPEARTISRLTNIYTLYEVRHNRGLNFLVLEFLEGETLAKRWLKGETKERDAYAQGG